VYPTVQNVQLGGAAMRCELCTRKLGANEVVNGIRFGIVDGASRCFVADRDSAPTIICSNCSSMLMKLIYAKLNRPSSQPVSPTYQRHH